MYIINMVGRGGYSHEKGLVDYLQQLRAKGWKTINLKGVAPDGIAIKDDQIVAVEILTYSDTDSKSNDIRMKKSRYFMFDDVFIKLVKRDKDEEKNNENRVYQIVLKKKKEERINEEWSKWDSILGRNSIE